jgi:hypothetical protein
VEGFFPQKINVSVDFPAGYGTGIVVFDNALPENLCDAIFSFFETHRDMAVGGYTISGTDPSVKWTEEFRFKNDDYSPARMEYDGLCSAVYDPFHECVAEYMRLYDWLNHSPGIYDTGYQWQWYEPGVGHYREHIDGDPWNDNPHNNGRVAGVVMYINDVEDGGETAFRYQNVAIKPKKGRIAIFPANWTHPHEAKIPMSGPKLIISSFLCSEKRFLDFVEDTENTPQGEYLPKDEQDS